MRWKLAAQNNGFGVWDYRPETNHLFRDDNMFAIFGLDPEHFEEKVETWQACVHPEDRAWASEALDKAARNNEKYEIIFRILRGTEIRYIAATAQSLLDEQGRVLRIIGLNWDVTEREEAMRLIQANLKEREATLNAVTEGFFALDAEGALQYWNPAAAQMLGLKTGPALRAAAHECL